MIKEIVGLLEEATSLPVSPEYIKGKRDCIVYNYYTATDDGAVSSYRLEIKVITNKYEAGQLVKDTVVKTLVTVGDEPLTNTILSCNVNGGGSLRDSATEQYQQIIYFDVITRSIKYER